MESNEKLLNVEEAALFLGISPKTLYQYVSMKKVPCIKFGNCLRFSQEQLWQWVKEHIVEPVL